MYSTIKHSEVHPDGKQPPPVRTCFLNCVQDMKYVTDNQ